LRSSERERDKKKKKKKKKTEGRKKETKKWGSTERHYICGE
jgi:hypothetical protein